MPCKDPEKRRATARKWAAKNKAHLAAYRSKYRQLNHAKQIARERIYYRSPKGRAITRNANLRKRCFTLTLFKSIMKAQGHRCAICALNLRKVPPSKIHADRCHKTKTPRGILCGPCNMGLGNFGDNPAFLKAAALYLKRKM
jgi:hypothetical protein